VHLVRQKIGKKITQVTQRRCVLFVTVQKEMTHCLYREVTNTGATNKNTSYTTLQHIFPS